MKKLTQNLAIVAALGLPTLSLADWSHISSSADPAIEISNIAGVQDGGADPSFYTSISSADAQNGFTVGGYTVGVQPTCSIGVGLLEGFTVIAQGTTTTTLTTPAVNGTAGQQGIWTFDFATATPNPPYTLTHGTSYIVAVQYAAGSGCPTNTASERDEVRANLSSYDMAKTANPTTITAPGDITYTFTFTNDGATTLSNLTVTDPDINTGSLTGCPIATLAPGATATCTATRTITQAQINAGVDIPNTATPSAEDPLSTIFPTVTESNTTNNTATVSVLRPSYNMVKTANPTTISAPGDITYTFTFTNNGGVTLSNLTVTDPDINAGSLTGCPIATLAVGATATCTATRTITQAQIDNGADIPNTATPSAEDGSGNPVNEDNDGDPTTPNDPSDNTATVPVAQTPSYNMVKTANPTTISAPGDITYTFTFTNNGNVTLSNLTVTDPDINAGSLTGCPIATLAVGATATCTATRTISQAQINAGTDIPNTATPSAEDGSGNPVDEDNDGDPTTPNDPSDNTATVTVTQTPLLALVKTGEFNDLNGNGFAEVGETITYNFTVTNTGNVDLTVTGVTDPMLPSLSCASLALPVGATDQPLTCTNNVYTLTAADIDAGRVDNTAEAEAVDVTSTTVTDTSGTDNTNNTPTTVVIRAVPVPVPTLSTYGLLTLLLAIFGITLYRRKLS